MTTSSVQSTSGRRGRGEQRVESFVALGDPTFHPARHHRVAALDGRVDAVRLEPGAAVAEVDEAQELQRHLVGGALVLEGLDRELVVTDAVEGAVEPVLLTLRA